ncbi:MAG: hypothetical protein MR924_05475, partial [Prevotella sp.]|nr:hypothetical protein [Prevotella sp.]
GKHLTVSRFLHSAKAYSLMNSTAEPIVTETRPLQPEYLEVIDYQLFAVNTVEKRIGYYLWGYGK